MYAIRSYYVNEFGNYYIEKGKEFYAKAVDVLSEEEYRKHANLYGFLFGEKNTQVILNCLDRVKYTTYQSRNNFV